MYVGVKNNGRIKWIVYTYDAAGQRISKRVTKHNSLVVDYTWYVRDASGNMLSMYSYSGDSTVATPLAAQNLIQNEAYLFGSSRLGSFTLNRNVEVTAQTIDSSFTSPLLTDVIRRWPFVRGNKQYELTNHQQTPMVTISDKKLYSSSNGTTVDFYLPDVISATGIYSGGMVQPGRSFSASKYQFSINGQLKTNEIAPNTTSAEFWEFDSRVMRRWNVDPVIKLWQSPYVCFSNSPTSRSDLNGDDDYFDSKGKYLGSDKNGTAVRIISKPIGEIKNLYSKDGATINKGIAQKNSQMLSNFINSTANSYIQKVTNFFMKTNVLHGVFNHYAKDADIKGEITAGMIDDKDVPAFTHGKEDSRYNLLYGGDLKILDNFNNIINIFYHEKLHQDDKKNNKKVESFADHAKIYINQFSHSSFKEMSKDAQIGSIGSAMDYILNEQYSTTDYSSGNSTITNSLIEELNKAIKSAGYEVRVGGGVTALNLYKEKKLVSTVQMTQKKDPN